MKRIAFPALVAAFLFPALAACGSSVDDLPRSGQATAEQTKKAGGASVVVLDAGSAPRQELRLTVAPGDKVERLMTMRLGLSMEMGGQTIPTTSLPTMVMGMTVTADKVQRDGVISSSYAYDSADVEGSTPVAAEIRKHLAGIAGITGTLDVTDTGEYVDGDLRVPASVDPLIASTLEGFKSQMKNLTVPLPKEAVGAGARWRVSTEAKLNGITSTLTSTYTLLKRVGDRLDLRVSIVQTAPEQDARIPNVPSSMTVHVDKVHVTGTGRQVLDLGGMLPVSSRSQVRGTIAMTISGDGQTQAIRENVSTKIRLSER